MHFTQFFVDERLSLGGCGYNHGLKFNLLESCLGGLDRKAHLKTSEPKKCFPKEYWAD
jgi:hypothetical protein